jgi:hypothetical protein
MRSRSEPGQVARAGFGFERIAVTQRVEVAAASSTGRAALAVAARRSAKRKTPKGGTKRAFVPGRTPGQGKARENLPGRRRCYKRHRWPVSEERPES